MMSTQMRLTWALKNTNPTFDRLTVLDTKATRYDEEDRRRRDQALAVSTSFARHSTGRTAPSDTGRSHGSLLLPVPSLSAVRALLVESTRAARSRPEWRWGQYPDGDPAPDSHRAVKVGVERPSAQRNNSVAWWAKSTIGPGMMPNTTEKATRSRCRAR